MKLWIIFTTIFATLHLFKSKSNLLKRKNFMSFFTNSATSDQEIMHHFKKFHKKHVKGYLIDSEQGNVKFNKFKDNFNFIKDHNSIKRNYTLGIGPFSDMTPDEFRETMLMKHDIILNFTKKFNSTVSQRVERRVLRAEQSSNVNASIPSYNWTYSYGPARTQGSCGCCWAFATCGGIESHYFLSFKTSLTLSPQQLVDCDTTSNGCNGGFPSTALTYIEQSGIQYESSYPFFSGTSNKAGTCQYSANQANDIVTSYTSCPQHPQTICGRNSIISMLANGPIIAVIDASSPILQHYTSGILDYKCTASIFDHAINIAGVGSDSMGGYYIVRNSWGSTWGENGYFRMRFDDSTNSCFLETNGWQPVVQQTNVIAPVVSPCLTFYSQNDFKGTAYNVCQTESNLPNFNGQVSGFVMGSASSVALYNSPNCTGSYQVFSGNVGSLSDVGQSSFINNVGSVIIDGHLQEPPQNCTWIYTGCCFSSNQLQICNAVPDLSQLPINFSNQINAMKFGPGVTGLQIFNNVNYGGGYITYHGDTPCVSPSISNKGNSLKLVLSQTSPGVSVGATNNSNYLSVIIYHLMFLIFVII